MFLPDWSGQAKEDWWTAIAAMSWPHEKYRWHTSNQNQNCVCVSFYLYHRCQFRIYVKYSVEIQWTQLNLARTFFVFFPVAALRNKDTKEKVGGAQQRNMLSTNCSMPQCHSMLWLRPGLDTLLGFRSPRIDRPGSPVVWQNVSLAASQVVPADIVTTKHIEGLQVHWMVEVYM